MFYHIEFDLFCCFSCHLVFSIATKITDLSQSIYSKLIKHTHNNKRFKFLIILPFKTTAYGLLYYLHLNVEYFYPKILFLYIVGNETESFFLFISLFIPLIDELIVNKNGKGANTQWQHERGKEWKTMKKSRDCTFMVEKYNTNKPNSKSFFSPIFSDIRKSTFAKFTNDRFIFL